MPLLDYYQRRVEQLRSRSPTEQESQFKQMLQQFSGANMDQLFADGEGVSNDNVYQALSALVARRYWLKRKNENPTLDAFSLIPTAHCMPDNLSIAQVNLIKKLINEEVVSDQDIITSCGNLDGNCVIDYLAGLPFPFNIQCLSEAMNNNTPWRRFFLYTTDQALGASIKFERKMMEHLTKANIAAFNGGAFSDISPVLATMVGNPDLKDNFRIIRSLLLNKNLSENDPANFIVNFRGSGLEFENIKNAIRTFINALPNSASSEEYLAYESVKQVLARKMPAIHVPRLQIPTDFRRGSSIQGFDCCRFFRALFNAQIAPVQEENEAQHSQFSENSAIRLSN